METTSPKSIFGEVRSLSTPLSENSHSSIKKIAIAIACITFFPLMYFLGQWLMG